MNRYFQNKLIGKCVTEHLLLKPPYYALKSCSLTTAYTFAHDSFHLALLAAHVLLFVVIWPRSPWIKLCVCAVFSWCCTQRKKIIKCCGNSKGWSCETSTQTNRRGNSLPMTKVAIWLVNRETVFHIWNTLWILWIMDNIMDMDNNG